MIEEKNIVKKIEKIFCVLLDNDSKYLRWNSKKPFIDFEFNIAYSLFSEIGKEFDIKVIFAKYSDYSNGFIKKYWFFEKKWEKSNNKVKPNLFYDKFPMTKEGISLKKKLSKKNILFNSFELELFCKDKYLQSKKFPEFSPKTFLIKNNKDFLKSFKKIESEKIILKPRYGLGSKGIKIFDKKEKIRKQNFSEDYILQEFIDTSKGIPELNINGVHDLRCVVVNGKICFSFVRIPKKGLIASIHRGGKAINVRVPKKVFLMVKKIDFFMKFFGNRFYSVDVFFSNNKYYLVELNSKPGFGVGVEFGFTKKEEELMKIVFKEIVSKHFYY
ncbi:MAG: ATP-grasp domain-containing protein [Candidatus ainarchaeum sp.]|nr:ATP-grasp domain-containing protein [Candidatus ainarchaeum sp.]